MPRLNDIEIANPTYDAELRPTVESVRVHANGKDSNGESNNKSRKTYNSREATSNNNRKLASVLYDSIIQRPENFSECYKAREKLYCSLNGAHGKVQSYEVPVAKSK